MSRFPRHTQPNSITTHTHSRGGGGGRAAKILAARAKQTAALNKDTKTTPATPPAARVVRASSQNGFVGYLLLRDQRHVSHAREQRPCFH